MIFAGTPASIDRRGIFSFWRTTAPAAMMHSSPMMLPERRMAPIDYLFALVFAMNHGRILDVGALAYADGGNIASDDGLKPNSYIFPDCYIACDYRIICNIKVIIHG
jgi:hypothetical protein